MEFFWRTGGLRIVAAVNLLFIRKRMKIAHQSFQTFIRKMRINLCCANISMAEQLLNSSQIGATIQQMAGEGVTQDVRADLRRPEAGRGGERLQFTGEVLAAGAPAAGRPEGAFARHACGGLPPRGELCPRGRARPEGAHQQQPHRVGRGPRRTA